VTVVTSPPDRGAPATQHLVLVGMMGVGKTTTGLALAARLDRLLRDCDRDLEARVGMTGAELAAARGVEELHRLEEEVLLDALASDGPTIVTAAGSVVTSERVRQRLAERATVVWLDAPIGELTVRMAADAHRRPLDPPATEALLARRREHLAEVADLRLDARAPTDHLVAAIVAFLGASDAAGHGHAPDASGASSASGASGAAGAAGASGASDASVTPDTADRSDAGRP
jgi:shikimate kinase